ncbi:universal stress protein [Leptodesmis sichuanensis]|uniref:universal stress protein n=1 Tax=Leptodesmis sichuanensis TaxID=2906798 RepID=UPI002358E050|nr:universal stress protein [Leptodesmis sichuanensis]UIE40114.1 universal stress protein [Leptodesmis sichuanensis A121]
MFKKILVAVSPAMTDDTLIHEAIDLAKLSGGTIMLLHVLSPMDEDYPTPVYPGPDSVYPGLHEEAIRAYAQQWEVYERQGLEFLQKLTKEVSAAGVSAEFTQSPGDPGRKICNLADTWEADLIILGRRGHTGLKEFFLGSVSNYVLHHAPCSVLTIQGVGVEGE